MINNTHVATTPFSFLSRCPSSAAFSTTVGVSAYKIAAAKLLADKLDFLMGFDPDPKLPLKKNIIYKYDVV